MKKIFRQIGDLADEHHCSIIYPGDIGHHWKATPELINFMIKYLPRGYSIPGQHDLPYHDYKQIKKSAYWTLVQAGVLTHLKFKQPTRIKYDNRIKMRVPSLFAHAFPWGKPIHDVFAVDPDGAMKKDSIHVAVIHKYTWTGGHCHPGAKQEDHVSELNKKLKGFDCAVVGDNHSGFLYADPKTKRHILNCGTVMRRRSDEKDYRPHVGLIYENGKIGLHYLDISHEKWDTDARDDLQKLRDMGVEVEEFVDSLKTIGEGAIDFYRILTEYLEKAAKSAPPVTKIVLAALEAARAKK